MTPALAEKFDRLRSILRGCGSVLVAYSGGVDSALVAAAASLELKEKALACIGVSPSYPAREMRHAIDVAKQMNIAYRVVNTEEHLDPRYAANPANRCYFCKSELHDRLMEIAVSEGWGAVCDGVHADDATDHRHGIAAAREHGVRSPLAEAGITKAEVRELARELNLPAWDKPAMACLSSRVPHGTPITPELLRQIETAEDALVELGFEQFRVRHHGQVARIEIPPEDFEKAMHHREEIVAALRAAGYEFVALDLAGFRSGSLSRSPDVVQLQISTAPQRAG